MKKCNECGKIFDNDVLVCENCGNQNFEEVSMTDNFAGEEKSLAEQNSNQVNGENFVQDENISHGENITQDKNISHGEYFSQNSNFKRFFHNLKRALETPKILVTVAILMIVCFMGFSYFLFYLTAYGSVEEVAGSLFLIDVVFLIFAIMFLSLFVASIVFNIKRIKNSKNKKK